MPTEWKNKNVQFDAKLWRRLQKEVAVQVGSTSLNVLIRTLCIEALDAREAERKK